MRGCYFHCRDDLGRQCSRQEAQNNPEPKAMMGWPLLVYGPDVVDGSPSTKDAIKFREDQGLTLYNPLQPILTPLLRPHSPESSAYSSHKLFHLPRSRGIPHSASKNMGRGVSLARS